MQEFVQRKKFRGVTVKIAANRLSIVIQKAQPQIGGRPTIGLSDALLRYANRYNLTIYVSVNFPNISFKTKALEWIKKARKEEQPSYYGIPWYIYRGEIPKEAFKDFGKTEEEKERERFYQSYSFV
jgi:hypothetical protein